MLHDIKRFGVVLGFLLIALPRVIFANESGPTAIDQKIRIPQDRPSQITLGAIDIDTAQDKISYSVIDGPSHGTLSGDVPNLIYTPSDPVYFGPDKITYKVFDGDFYSNTATINISVAKTYVVNSLDGTANTQCDATTCTIYGAVNKANTDNYESYILFSQPGIIQLAATLYMTDYVYGTTVDGGVNHNAIISYTPAQKNHIFIIQSANNTIKGMVLQNAYAAILIAYQSATGNRVQRCYIGVDSAGISAASNLDGIVIRYG